jgi:hypothetical protein
MCESTPADGVTLVWPGRDTGAILMVTLQRSHLCSSPAAVFVACMAT